jgi:hypothetical protein
MKLLWLVMGIMLARSLSAQVISTDTTTNAPLNSAQNLLNSSKKIFKG